MVKPSPEHSTRDPEVIRTPSKRKEKHDDDHHAEHTSQPMKKARLHDHQSGLVSATKLPILPEPVDLPPLASRSSNVLARITFPEGESTAFKKRKLCSSAAAVNVSSHHRSHITTSNGYHEDHHKIAAAVSKNSYNYESSHNGRHFKRMRNRSKRHHLYVEISYSSVYSVLISTLEFQPVVIPRISFMFLSASISYSQYSLVDIASH